MRPHITPPSAKAASIGVIGTQITEAYLPQDSTLQEEIAREHLLISQVPIWRYSMQGHRLNRFFFPGRDATMSALTHGTVVVSKIRR